MQTHKHPTIQCPATVRLLIAAVGVASLVTPARAEAPPTVMGRYVHVMLPGNNHRELALAEVEVFSTGKNVAFHMSTRQTSVGGDGVSERAVDGNTDGDGAAASTAYTHAPFIDPAWEVDLGKPVAIDKIVVWTPRIDLMNDMRVFVLNAHRKVIWGTSLAKCAQGANPFLIKDHPTCEWLGQRVACPNWNPDTPSTHKDGTPQSLRLAITDLTKTFGARYPRGKEFLDKLTELEPNLKTPEGIKAYEALRNEALMANPLLDFDKLLLVRRKGASGLPANWQGNSSLGKTFDNELTVLSPLLDGNLKTLYRPDKQQFVGDFDLHFNADKILFSSLAPNNSWAIFEIKADGSGLRQVSPDLGADVDCYDPVYLPDGRIIFDSSLSYAGVPCVGGADYVANLHIMNADGSGLRRLCFEQDNDWYPVVLNNGRVMYLRWEYTDSAHYFSRVLMHMNPDGTDQKSFYHSNSYWPNSLFYARPIPGSATQFVGIISGHHGAAREGELVVFDAARGTFEADGAIQRIPGYGKKVEAITKDTLVDSAFPRFLHPYPLSDKYFLASCNLKGSWGIYLVDVFDNLLLLKKDDGAMLLEPVPFRKTVTPPVIPDRIVPDSKEATMLITDIYAGGGLAGVPRGTVKSIRVYQYEFSPRRAGGHYAMGMEAGWDQHIILGTAPVESDGSAAFKVPANTPVSLQPLDKDGRAVAIMRSWTTAMPGENLSCVGCHENQNSAPPTKQTIAQRIAPHALKPWFGPARGFSFAREVQPVMDKYCAGCHDDKGGAKPDLSEPNRAYNAIHPYVRRNGPEGNYHLLMPLEFHADTSELIQMLEKGHHNVKLDDDAWSHLVTWIDLNAPNHGTWAEAGAGQDVLKRRMELNKQYYAEAVADTEKIHNPYKKSETFVKPEPVTAETSKLGPATPAGWPFSAETAKTRQGPNAKAQLDLGDDVKLDMVRIPAGSFLMGSNAETPMERPITPVTIKSAFWMGAKEVSLEEYRQFDPDYQNGIYDMHYKDQVKPGYDMNHVEFPVIRVSWQKAMEYCQWLSKKTGRKVTLPTEAQWEWACRAGSATPFSYGDLNTDFSTFANLADVTVKQMAVSGVDPQPINNPGPNEDFELKDARFNDGVLHLAPTGKYQPNPWGLCDMHGNVAEWTRSDYKPYPYNDSDGRNSLAPANQKVVRGGSWHDRPLRSTSTFRLGYPSWQRVYHVGFRVVVEN
ncbi:MAG: SUMF1/EgtB/PvdO family nonheme iron enzyme [Verrucomicrobiota bacterium]